MKALRFLTIAIAALGLTACNTVMEERASQEFALDYDQVVPVKEKQPDGAIFARNQAGFFLGARKARNVGDVLTVVLSESTTGGKTAKSAMNKGGETTVTTLPQILFGPLAWATGVSNLAVPQSFNAQNADKFDGSGTAEQKNNLSGQISVVVTRVYENGNMAVQGQKQIKVGQGYEYVRLTGIVRPEDVNDRNGVESFKIAQANISYTGSGDLQDQTLTNWYWKFFNFVAPI
jgi:flagellar L-ring protein precursor FlgH